jgi:8-oxo-dGTP pyrophosphatase MutT (NUDIX family)
MKKTFSAGGVVVNSDGLVLVVNQNGDSWSLPKGHIDPGEDARTAAAREIQEESGIKQLDFVKELGEYQRHQIGINGGDNPEELKTITMFLYRTAETELRPEDPRNPEAKWVEAKDVLALLTHPKDKEFFESAWQKIASL